MVRHRRSSENTPLPTPGHSPPLAGNLEEVQAGDTGVPTSTSLPVSSPRSTAGGRWGGRSIFALPALAAELGCSQHFYFKPHSVFEEASGVHS